MSVEIDLTPSNETIQRVRKAVGLDENSINQAVEGLRNWLELQPHLPDEDDYRLERWLIRCKNNMEKTKETIDMYYTMRTLVPELTTNMRADLAGWDDVEKCGFLIIEPKLTDDLDRVSVFGFHPGSEDFNLYDTFKALLASLDVRMCEDYFVKDIYVIDLKNFTASHITKLNPPFLKKFIDCALKGYSIRIRAIHIINVPVIAEMFISLAKSLLKNKLAQRVHVYGSDFKELYDHVPRSLLPVELGGESGNVKEKTRLWKQKLFSYDDWFQKQENKKSDESKRPGGKHYSTDMFGVDGSFRKLTID